MSEARAVPEARRSTAPAIADFKIADRMMTSLISVTVPGAACPNQDPPYAACGSGARASIERDVESDKRDVKRRLIGSQDSVMARERRQRDDEGRSVIGAAVNCDRAVMTIDDPLDQAQPQARAIGGRRARGIG